MKVRRKSLWRSENTKRAINKKFANMRAAKERKRMERAFAEPVMPDLSHCEDILKGARRPKPSGFMITIRCLDDGESARLVIPRGPYGLMPSPTVALRRIGYVLKQYFPIPA